jgi:hypothetical protein
MRHGNAVGQFGGTGARGREERDVDELTDKGAVPGRGERKDARPMLCLEVGY